MIVPMRIVIHGLNVRNFVGILLLLPTLAFGHAPPPEHGCHAPRRPPDNVDEATWNRFLSDVDRYRSCISDFVAANRAAAENHYAAASAATDAWNGFVRDSLNAPQDFPWPPEDPVGADSD